jgi:hypothetical protein
MTLLSAADAARVPAFHATENTSPADKVAQVKYFTPWTNWTWSGIEFNPADQVFFGLVIGHEIEFGYFALAELESVRGPFGLRIERDIHFKPTRLGAIPGVEL